GQCAVTAGAMGRVERAAVRARAAGAEPWLDRVDLGVREIRERWHGRGLAASPRAHGLTDAPMATDGRPEPPSRVVPVADSATLDEETAAVGVRRQRIGAEAPPEKPYRRTQHPPPPGRHTKS